MIEGRIGYVAAPFLSALQLKTLLVIHSLADDLQFQILACMVIPMDIALIVKNGGSANDFLIPLPFLPEKI